MKTKTATIVAAEAEDHLQRGAVQTALGFDTSDVPAEKITWEPRVGFNWDIGGAGTQLGGCFCRHDAGFRHHVGRGQFDVEIRGSADDIASVTLLRSDHNTHSLTAGDRYVKLAFREKSNSGGNGKGRHGDRSKGELRVIAPSLPSQAIPGIYMLFVIDEQPLDSTANDRMAAETSWIHERLMKGMS